MKRVFGVIITFLLVWVSTINFASADTFKTKQISNIDQYIDTAGSFQTKRLDGKDRFAVSVNVSQEGWPSGAETVFITNYIEFADALSAAPLAYQDDAPILLTKPDNLPTNILNEIKRLHPRRAVIVGGEGSVSSKVFSQLKSLVGNVTRIGGKDRFEVALNISKRFNQSKIIVANGLLFSDALTIAPYAALNNIPILLTRSNRLPDSTKQAIANKQQTLVIGGEGSVNSTVYNQLPGHQRIGGKDRYEVAENIINTLNMNTDKLFIATGLTFADALTGSVLAAKEDAPLMLTRSDRLPVSTKKVVLNNNVNDFVVLGGAASVQDKTVSSLKPIENTHSIEGYSDKISYFPGDTVNLMVHAPEGKFSLDVERFGTQEKTMYSATDIFGESQNYFPEAYMEGALWKPSYSFKIPVDWPSGMYAAKVYDQSKEFYITFIVKSKSPSHDTIGVISSTNTWEAYNSWGGKSLYSHWTSGGKIVFNPIVSYDRPNPGAIPIGDEGHLANGERHILSWLEENNYKYSMIADKDVDQNPSILKQFNTIIISTHSEYWSTKMYNGLTDYLNSGGNLLYLSGNGIYWRAVLKNNQIEVKKDGSRHTFDSEMGGNYYKLGRNESTVLGVSFHSTGYSTPSPYKVLNSRHWIFANTGLKNGDLIGQDGLNRGGASGWETDQMDSNSPKNAVLLAKGTNTTGAGADMVYYDHPGGGGVFSVGSITFGGSLVVDNHLSQIVKNVLNNFAER